MGKPVDVSSGERSASMPSSVNPVRDLSHTISTNGTNNPDAGSAARQESAQTTPHGVSDGCGSCYLPVWPTAAFAIGRDAQKKAQAVVAAQESKAAHRAVPVVAVPARVGDLPVYLRGLGSVTPFNTVTVKSRVDGQLMAVHFTGGPIRQAGRTAGGDRSAPVPGATGTGRGTTGARPGPAQRRQGKSGALPGVVGSQSHRQAAARYAGRLSRPVRGLHQGGPVGHRQCEAAAHLLEDHRAHQRPHRTAAGGRGQHRSRRRRRTAW